MNRPAAAPPRQVPQAPPAAGTPLRRVRRAGYAVLAAQLAGFLAWSTILYRHFALTFDFAIYHQAWYLIAHGDLNPYDTVAQDPFWQNHSEFIMWPLALLYWVWPQGITLLVIQDLSVAGAEVVTFTWICELAGRYRQGREAGWLAAFGLVLLVADPWMWWAVSFDFHLETLALLFAALLAWDLANGRRRAWIWAGLLLTCGDVAATYLAGIGLGAALAGRGSRARGAAMAGLGVAATLAITLVHGNRGSGGNLHAYAYLAATGSLGTAPSLSAMVKGILAHPVNVLRTLWAKRTDVLANLAPAGLVGVCYPMVLPVIAVVILADTLFHGLWFAEPVFQNLPIYMLLPAGTVAVCGWLARRRRRLALLLTGLITAQTLMWAAVWGPRTPGQWLRVPGATAATLAGLQARIPASAELVVSQGVIGRFAGHAQVRSLSVPGPVPLQAGQDWFIIVPSAGVELQSTASAMAFIAELAGPLGATLVTHANGVWAFRWHPPPGMTEVTVPGNSSPLAAWASAGAAGRAVTAGPAADWHVTSAGGRGYVADELGWLEPPGQYQALVTLSATGPVNVEVWNDTGNVLLARQTIMPTNGVQTVALGVNATTGYAPAAYPGWGPFRAEFVPPPPGNRLEVRIWSPGDEAVNVYSAELVAAPGPPGPG